MTLTPYAPATRRCLCLMSVLLIYLVTWTAYTQGAETDKNDFVELQQRLVKDGFDKDYITKLYNRSDVHLEIKGISLFSVHNEAKLNYDQFLSRSSIRRAKRYLNVHAEDLARAEKNYGVEKEIITAIMLVETRLGVFTGNSPIFNTLSTMAALADKAVRERIWDNLEADGPKKRKKFDDWADRKSKWGYKELKAYLTYTQQAKVDPVKIQGSYAGAIGIAQFMPTNIVALAKDGNDDGRIDLFTHTDAIASIANYLKHHGWKPGLSRIRKYRVLLKYNYSKYYANTLLKIADKLKG